MMTHHAQMARVLADELGPPADVLGALSSAYEQWDGRGWPGQLKGAEVPIASRLVQIAEFVEVAYSVGGVEAARALVRRRAGAQFDPQLATVAGEEAEPALAVEISAEQFDETLVAIANFVDLKSPYTVGHSQAVADLAGTAAEHLGTADQVRRLRRAGLVHDLGRLGVSNSIWDKPGPISPKTVGNHIEHIYKKIGASNRAAASLFAIKHGLLPTDELIPA